MVQKWKQIIFSQWLHLGETRGLGWKNNKDRCKLLVMPRFGGCMTASLQNGPSDSPSLIHPFLWSLPTMYQDCSLWPPEQDTSEMKRHCNFCLLPVSLFQIISSWGSQLQSYRENQIMRNWGLYTQVGGNGDLLLTVMYI